MADGRAAYDPDRLPWLSDERKPRRKGDWTSLLLWAGLAALLVAGVSYWLGTRSVREPEASQAVRTSPPAATVRLPEAAINEPPAEQVQPPPMNDVQPVAEPTPVQISRPEPARATRVQASRRASARARPRVVVHRARPRPAPVRKPVAVRRPAAMQVWPASVSEGAWGRVVRIGAYGSRRQAKLGWWQIVRRYPGMRRLRAVVAPVQSRTGQIYYRLQFGTTSQAHSEVLCQRMRTIRQTCAVIGLPGR